MNGVCIPRQRHRSAGLHSRLRGNRVKVRKHTRTNSSSTLITSKTRCQSGRLSREEGTEFKSLRFCSHPKQHICTFAPSYEFPNPRPFRPISHRLPSCGRCADCTFQLVVRAPPRRKVHPSNRRHGTCAPPSCLWAERMSTRQEAGLNITDGA